MKLRLRDRIPDTDVLERTGILSINVMLRQLQLRWSGHLARMDDERLPKRLFYGDVATGSRRQGQIRRYKDTLTSTSECLQINPANWEDLARVRPTWRTVKTGAAIFEAKRETPKSRLPSSPPHNAKAQAPPTTMSPISLSIIINFEEGTIARTIDLLLSLKADYWNSLGTP
nr:unnamed protein product [Spirometra erinaceieuropaei]